MTKKAEAGTGTLILFIAMILVAAVAAGVLIQTASSLQSKALYTGSRAKTQVSTQVAVIYMWGENGTTMGTGGREINRTLLKVKLASGSDPVKLNDTLVQVDTPSNRVNLEFNSSVDCSNNNVIDQQKNDYYGGTYLVGGTENGYLRRGDIFQICLALPESVQEGEDVTVSIIPKVGYTTRIETKTPDVMLSQRVQLYP
jgi:flagellin-like protein